MAYEVVFKYYDIKDDGSFCHDSPQEIKKKFGNIETEYPLDKLMSNITGYLARRDIYVFDVDVYEFTRKKIPFKITKNGLVLKNQKVSYDDMLENTVLIAEKPQVINQVENNQNQKTTVVNQNKNRFENLADKIIKNKNKKPNRFVVFSPPLNVDKSKFNFKFSKNKKYPVFSERYAENGIGMILSMIDDAGNDVEVHDEYFVPFGNNLEYTDEMNLSKKDGNFDLLNWQGDGNDTPPVLR
jgi:hypothetical protein